MRNRIASPDNTDTVEDVMEDVTNGVGPVMAEHWLEDMEKESLLPSWVIRVTNFIRSMQ